MLLQATLNGRLTKDDHSAVPVTLEELAADAAACVAAGARAFHVHPRDASGAESLDARVVDRVVAAVREPLGLPVGVTTGAWIEPDLPRRLQLVREWTQPDYTSVNLSEPGAIEVMQALWAEPHITFAGKHHTIEDAGINPRPASGRVPIWFGGHAEVTMQRVVKWGDGWMPLNYAPGDEAVAAFDKLRAMAEAAGRDPASIGIDTRTTVGIGAEAEWRESVCFWKSCGVTHLTLGTYSGRGHLRRIEGRTLGDHLAAIKRYWSAVADLL